MSAEAVETGPTTQQRKKPIRTYGRRSAAATAANKGDAKPSTPRQLSPQDPPAPQLPPPSLPAPVPPSVECPKPNAPKPGSILSYFKTKPKTPAPTTSEAITTGPSASDELILTPPSPPPSGSGQRKRRRLTTRPTFDDDAAGDNQAGKKRKASGDDTPEARDGTPISTSSASQPEIDSTGTSTASKQLVTQKKHTAKTPTKDMVQTTLSLAIGEPRPQFIVCRECSMLYNHLNDKDRKDHKRVHMAYIRSKNKESEEICER